MGKVALVTGGLSLLLTGGALAQPLQPATHEYFQATVKDYDGWKKGFDADEKMRADHGVVHPTIYRQTTDPNEVLVIFDVSNPSEARALSANIDLQAIMAKAGITQTSYNFTLLPGASTDTAHFKQCSRLNVTDQSKWLPAFEKANAVRLQNGLSNPQVYTNVSNPSDLIVAFDVANLLKAQAFMKIQSQPDVMNNIGAGAVTLISYQYTS